MDLNRFKNLNIANNSPRRLRNRNIYSNITVTTLSSSSTDNKKSSSKSTVNIEESNGINIEATSSSHVGAYECTSNSNISIRSSECSKNEEEADEKECSIEENDDGRDEFVHFSSDSEGEQLFTINVILKGNFKNLSSLLYFA